MAPRRRGEEHFIIFIRAAARCRGVCAPRTVAAWLGLRQVSARGLLFGPRQCLPSQKRVGIPRTPPSSHSLAKSKKGPPRARGEQLTLCVCLPFSWKMRFSKAARAARHVRTEKSLKRTKRSNGKRFSTGIPVRSVAPRNVLHCLSPRQTTPPVPSGEPFSRCTRQATGDRRQPSRRGFWFWTSGCPARQSCKGVGAATATTAAFPDQRCVPQFG